jgi:hypothetical protein
MTVTKLDMSEVIKDFTYKVRNYIMVCTSPANEVIIPADDREITGGGTTTNSSADHRTVGQIVPHVMLPGGPANSTTDPGGPVTPPSGTPINGAQLINLLQTWMTTYARVRKVRFNSVVNSPSVPDPSQTYYVDRVVRLNNNNPSVTANVTNDFNAAVASAQLGVAQVVTADKINQLINACQDIWRSRCREPVAENYSYNYCHSNFSSHANHGSRGRR